MVVVVVGGGGLEQGPLVLGLGLKGLGLRVWGQGLTIIYFRRDLYRLFGV